MARGTRGARRGEAAGTEDRCPKIEAGYGVNPGDCACGNCPEVRSAPGGRETEALAGLLSLPAREAWAPAGIKSGHGLSRDFMVGWSVLASYVRLAGTTKRKAERFVAQEARRTMSLGVEAGAEYLRGLRAGLSAAVAR